MAFISYFVTRSCNKSNKNGPSICQALEGLACIVIIMYRHYIYVVLILSESQNIFIQFRHLWMEKNLQQVRKNLLLKRMWQKNSTRIFLNLTQFCILIFMELCFLGINYYYEIITAVHSDSEVLTLIKRQKLKLKSS